MFQGICETSGVYWFCRSQIMYRRHSHAYHDMISYDHAFSCLIPGAGRVLPPALSSLWYRPVCEKICRFASKIDSMNCSIWNVIMCHVYRSVWIILNKPLVYANKTSLWASRFRMLKPPTPWTKMNSPPGSAQPQVSEQSKRVMKPFPPSMPKPGMLVMEWQ